MAYSFVPFELNNTDFVPGADVIISLFSKIRFEYLPGVESIDKRLFFTGTETVSERPLFAVAFASRIRVLLSVNWQLQKIINAEMQIRSLIAKDIVKKIRPFFHYKAE